jgi:hypothetical protein
LKRLRVGDYLQVGLIVGYIYWSRWYGMGSVRSGVTRQPIPVWWYRPVPRACACALARPCARASTESEIPPPDLSLLLLQLFLVLLLLPTA